MSLYEDADYYGMLFDARAHDLAFYLETAGEASSVLEYGVGNGRVALPLARAGHWVTGVDLSASMLTALAARLRSEPEEVRARVEIHEANAREVSLGKTFDAVYCPFNGIAHHHTRSELAAFFSKVREHLCEGGVFAFDTLIPEPKHLAGVTSTVPWFRHPKSGVVSRCTEEMSYETLAQVLTIRTTVRAMEGEERAEVLALRLRQFFPEETLLLLEHHGFEVLRRVELGDSLGYVCRAVLAERAREAHGAHADPTTVTPSTIGIGLPPASG